MLHSLARRSACALLLAVSACASGGAAAGTGSSAHVTAPTLRNRDLPDFTRPSSTADTRTDISVMVDPDGSADMSTLKVTGTGASATQQPVTDWLSHSMFAPGTSNGVPVRAEFRMSIKSSVRRVR